MQTLSDFVSFRKSCPFCNSPLYISIDYEYYDKLNGSEQIDLAHTLYRKSFGIDFVAGYQVNLITAQFVLYDRKSGIKKQFSEAKYKRLQKYFGAKNDFYLHIYCRSCFYNLEAKIQMNLQEQKIVFIGDTKELFDANMDVEIENHLNEKRSIIWRSGDQINIADNYFDPADPEKLKKDLQMLLLFS